MPSERGALDIDDLLKIILVLVIVWLVFEILGTLLSITFGFFRQLGPFLGLLVVVLIVLWYFDYL